MKRTHSASPSFTPARIPPLNIFSRTFAALAATLAIATVALPSPQAAEPVKPPVTKRATVTTEHHGIAHTDDYAWLKSGSRRRSSSSPRRWRSPIRAHLDAEGAYARAMLGAQSRARAPPGGGDAGASQPARPDGAGAVGARGNTSRAIPSARSASCTAGGRATAGPSRSCSTRTRWRAAGAPSPSPRSPSAPTTSSWPIRSTRTARSATRLKVRDLATGRDLADSIAEVRGGAVWSRDSQWLFYVGRDPVKWGQKVFRHRLGTPTAEDQLVYEEMEEGFSVSLRADPFRPVPGDRGRRLLDDRPAGGRSRPSDRVAAGGHRAQAREQVLGDERRRSPDRPDQRGRRHRLEDRREAGLGAGRALRCGRSCPIAPDA